MFHTGKVGVFSGDLGVLVRKYSADFQLVPLGRADVVKYGLVKREPSGSYIVMISGSEGLNPLYNLIITVFGPEKVRAEELVSEIEKKIGLKLSPAPDFLKKEWGTIVSVMKDYVMPH
jgi:hypothetical protein